LTRVLLFTMAHCRHTVDENELLAINCARKPQKQLEGVSGGCQLRRENSCVCWTWIYGTRSTNITHHWWVGCLGSENLIEPRVNITFGCLESRWGWGNCGAAPKFPLTLCHPSPAPSSYYYLDAYYDVILKIPPKSYFHDGHCMSLQQMWFFRSRFMRPGSTQGCLYDLFSVRQS
jgi:hypothetical protein